VDLTGGGRHSGFSHVHGFLGPRAYLSLGTVARAFANHRRAPFCARHTFARPTRFGARLPAAAMVNDVEEAWVRLTDTDQPPTQEEKDLALRWTAVFPKRVAMARLLLEHGAQWGPDILTAMALGTQPIDPCSEAQLADSVFNAESALSARYQPQAQDVIRAVPARARALQLTWLMLAGKAMRFDEATVSAAILTLDRYYASCREPPTQEQLNTVLLAALCIEMKLSGTDNLFDVDRILTHLTQGRVPLADVFTQEVRTLTRLGFVAGVPGPIALLRGLSFRLGEAMHVASNQAQQSDFHQWQDLAMFLLELVSLDAALAYSYPHALLATAALGASMLCLGPVRLLAPPGGEGAERDHATTLRRTLLACLEGFALKIEGDPAEQALLVEERIFAMWADCECRSSNLSQCYDQVCSKHAEQPWIREPDQQRPASPHFVLAQGLRRFEDLHGYSAASVHIPQ